MNNNISPLYKAIEARAEGHRLPVDFSSRVMAEIMVADCRRRRRELLWSIVGYVAAAVVTVGSVVYFCSEIFVRFVADTIAGFAAVRESDFMQPELGLILTMLPSAALLLLLDLLLRRRLAMKHFTSSGSK